MISNSIEFSPWTGRTFLFAYLSLHFFDDKQTQTQNGKLKLTKTTKFQATLNVADYIYIINNSSSFLYFTCVSLTFRSLAFNSSFFSFNVLNYTQFFCIHCMHKWNREKQNNCVSHWTRSYYYYFNYNIFICCVVWCWYRFTHKFTPIILCSVQYCSNCPVSSTLYVRFSMCLYIFQSFFFSSLLVATPLFLLLESRKISLCK